MNTHKCRKCGCVLTVDNTYSSNIKKHNWICKHCDNKMRGDRYHKKNKKQQQQKQQSSSITVTSHSCANHLRNSTNNHTPRCCHNCFAYDPSTTTCHLNPPPWPMTNSNGWCTRYKTKNI